MNLIELIESEMLDDDEDLDKQSDYLAALYDDASADGKDLLDRAFIALCGWSLGTLIEMQRSTS